MVGKNQRLWNLVSQLSTQEVSVTTKLNPVKSLRNAFPNHEFYISFQKIELQSWIIFPQRKREFSGFRQTSLIISGSCNKRGVLQSNHKCSEKFHSKMSFCSTNDQNLDAQLKIFPDFSWKEKSHLQRFTKMQLMNSENDWWTTDSNICWNLPYYLLKKNKILQKSYDFMELFPDSEWILTALASSRLSKQSVRDMKFRECRMDSMVKTQFQKCYVLKRISKIRWSNSDKLWE